MPNIINKGKTIAAGLLAGVVGWVAVNAIFDLYAPRPEAENRLMQLAPYREGMSLREVFDTFPAYGAGRADLRLLQDNTLAWAARWDLLDSAQESIDVSYFILKQDVFGIAFLSHLLKKAKEGVKVRILLDAYGSKLSWHPEGNDYLDALVNTGNAEVRIYRPLLKRVLQGVAHLSLAVAVASEHDKILVVDGKRAITGGRNIANEYFAHPDDAPMVFRDLEIEIAQGGAAAALIEAFETQYLSDGAEPVSRERFDLASQEHDLIQAYRAMDAWLRHDTAAADGLANTMAANGRDWAAELLDMRHLKGILAHPLPPYERAEIHVLDSSTRFKAPNDTISQAATRLIQSARQEIFIQTPYVVVSDEAVEVFSGAGRRGVPIQLFTNSPASADSVTAQAFFLEQWPHLLARVPNLHLYANAETEMIHTKLATFDGRLSLVGTYNLSPFSMATNSEVVVAIWSPEFAAQLTARPRAHLAAGPPRVYRYRIQRHADGTPKLDHDGQPIIAFGPEDHVDLQDKGMLQAVWKTLRAAEIVTGVSPFF